MKTLVLDGIARPDEAVDQAAAMLRRGLLVAIPTETVYGLAALASDQAAVRALYRIKGRSFQKPLTIHIGDRRDIDKLAEDLPLLFDMLAARYFPGPLTLVVRKQAWVPDIVTAGLPALGLRMPDHPLALRVIRAVGEPLVASSANLSGQASAIRAEQVLRDFESDIAAIVDGGECPGAGRASTVVDLLSEPPMILRRGSITAEELTALTGTEFVTAKKGKTGG